MFELYEKANKNEEIEPGDIVCIDDNGLAKKVDNQLDLTRVIGVCSTDGFNDDDSFVKIALLGKTYVKTNDTEIKAGEWLVSEIDGTAKCRTASDDDLDVIGMAMKKPENGKVLIKIK